MNISDFTYLLKEPESFRYNDQLKVTAAHTADRTVLFDFITSDKFKKPIVSSTHKDPLEIKVETFEEIKSEPENITSEEKLSTEEIIVESTTTKEDIIEEVVTIENPSQPKEKVEEIEVITSTTEIENDVLEVDKPLEFDKNERFSFNQWLQLSTVKPIDRGEEKVAIQEITSSTSDIEAKQEKTSEKQEEPTARKVPSFEDKLALIDRFIEKNPKIRPSKENIPIENLAEGNLVDRNELATETLAKVYLAQKKYKKAIQAYKILSLKYPEKNSFFADRIQEIKNSKKNK